MSTRAEPPPTQAAPLFVPAEWQTSPGVQRDVALDLLRGLAIAILVVNHTRLESVLGQVTGAVLSAAEVLVSVSGIVVGMVFGRRWLEHGPRATAAMLLRRARKLYLASVVVVALVGAAKLVPGLATDALTLYPNATPATDLYRFDGALRTGVAILTLEAGPWPFNILGLFIACLSLAPLVLWGLARGGWAHVLVFSGVLFVLGRELQVDVLPSQSERPFPILVWQLLFVAGMVAGWHRDAIARRVSRAGRIAAPALLTVAAAFALAQIVGPHLVGAAGWASWEAEHFDKRSLDPLRIAAMGSIAGALYLIIRRHAATAERRLGPLLLPLGQNSFYVFIVHVFVLLALASIPAIAAGDGLGPVGNALVQGASLALLWTMARRRVLFRWVPR